MKYKDLNYFLEMKLNQDFYIKLSLMELVSLTINAIQLMINVFLIMRMVCTSNKRTYQTVDA